MLRASWCLITTIDTDTVESLPSMFMQHTENYLNLCIFEGLVVKFDSAEPWKGARVFAKLFDGYGEQQRGNFSIGKDIAETFTDEYGRWRLSVPRCVKIYLEIVETKFTGVIHVPDAPACYFSQIMVDNGWRFNIDARPVTGGDII